MASLFRTWRFASENRNAGSNETNCWSDVKTEAAPNATDRVATGVESLCGNLVIVVDLSTNNVTLLKLFYSFKSRTLATSTPDICVGIRVKDNATVKATKKKKREETANMDV